MPGRQDAEERIGLNEVHARKGGIVATDVPAVVDEVGQLDGLCPRAGLREVAQVQGLALGAVAVHRPAHVREFDHQMHHASTEIAFDVAEGGGGVLHCVMQPGCGQHLGVVGDLGHEFSHGLQVLLIRLAGVLAAVVDAGVGLRGELAGTCRKSLRVLR